MGTHSDHVVLTDWKIMAIYSTGKARTTPIFLKVVLSVKLIRAALKGRYNICN